MLSNRNRYGGIYDNLQFIDYTKLCSATGIEPAPIPSKLGTPPKSRLRMKKYFLTVKQRAYEVVFA